MAPHRGIEPPTPDIGELKTGIDRLDTRPSSTSIAAEVSARLRDEEERLTALIDRDEAVQKRALAEHVLKQLGKLGVALIPWAVVIAMIAVLGYVVGTSFGVGAWFGHWMDIVRDSSAGMGARIGSALAWLLSVAAAVYGVFIGGRLIYETIEERR